MTDGLDVVNTVRFLIQVCKGIIRSHQVRRTLMFYDMLVVLVLVFLGSTFLWPSLRAHPLFFLGYWSLCGWLTILAALLAVYDMVQIRLQTKHAESQLRQEFLSRKDSDSSHDSHST